MTPERFPTFAAEESLRARRDAGLPVVALHGTPTPALPSHVVEAVAAALAAPQRTAPARGLGPLRVTLARWIEATAGRAPDPETEVLVTNGAMHGLGVVFRALLGPGDEVLLPTPTFFFGTPIRAAGGVPVAVPSSGATGWRWDVDALRAAIGPRTRMLVLCNPGNPTGLVPTRADVDAAVALAVEHDLLVVTDEAYESALWHGARLASAFSAAEHVVLVRSLGKSLSLATMRIGLVAGPAALVDRCARVLEWDCLRIGVAAQVAAQAALTGDGTWLAAVHRDQQACVDLAGELVRAAGLPFVRPEATPFLFVGDGSDPSLATRLLDAGLPVVDGACFGAAGRARLPVGGAVAAREELVAALTRLAGAEPR